MSSTLPSVVVAYPNPGPPTRVSPIPCTRGRQERRSTISLTTMRTAGDFVRNCRQLLDLLRQLRDAYPALANVTRDAIKAIDRGVVAIGGRV